MEQTILQLDKETSKFLGNLAKEENRTKVDELRFLVKERSKQLGLKVKWERLNANTT